MKIKSTLMVIWITLLSCISTAQDLNTKILMTVGKNKVQAGEFIRMYKKSTEPGKTLDVDEYLKQFIIFKLKVQDAMHLGYDTSRSFKSELNGYRNQLAQTYLTDTQTKEKLLQKAYQRSQTEINCWHILVSLSPEASPEDTLKAWKKASDIKERIMLGESFENVARGASDDQSVKLNGGNLGYITVFQTIMPFEDAAYSLKKGAISEPVRTPYGYHIIKVTDKRPARGRIKVAHIMIAAPPGTGEDEVRQAKIKIDSVYRLLQAGASFSDLAKKYSDHKESAVRGGELDWFGTGEIISDFSEAAFSLRDTGSYTKPVRTLYGWHIIKLLDKKAPGSFAETRSFLESKINQSYLNSLSKKSFVEKLKKEYKYHINRDAYDWFVKSSDTLIIQGKKKYDRTTMPPVILYSFADKSVSTKDFADYIEQRGPRIITRDSVRFIDFSIDENVSELLINYENSVLEKKYPEFRYLMNEFHDGILLFNISEKKIWNKVNDDSAALHLFYEEHKMNYLSKRGIEASIYTLKSPGRENQLEEALKKYSHDTDMNNRLLKKFNNKNDTLLNIRDGKWLRGDDPAIDKLEWMPGTQALMWKGYPSFIVIRTILEPVPLSFKEVQADVMSAYQENLENAWVKQLKESYNVKVDNMVLDEVKKKLSHE